MRLQAAILLMLAGCGEKSTPGGETARPIGDAGAANGAPAAKARVKVTLAWSWGDPPKGELGLRERDPNEPLPTGPAFIAAGKGRLLVATRDNCLELLDGKTGKPVAARRCGGKDAHALGLAVIGDVAVLARHTSVHGISLDDLRELWKREPGFVQSNHPLARPGAVGGRFCAVINTPKGGTGIECLDPASGKPGNRWGIPGASRVAFGERRIGIIPGENPPRANVPASGIEMPVDFYTVDGKRTGGAPLAGTYGPTFERSRPLFVVRGGGNQQRGGWTTRFVDPDGIEILTARGKEMLRGGAPVGKDVLTSQFGAAGGKDRAALLRPPDGASAWLTDLGVSGPWDPFAIAIGKTAFVTQGGKLFALEVTSGAIVQSFDLESERHAVWQDRLLFLVSARESRSDSDFGDAAVHAVDAASLEVVLRHELGNDVPGGQHASAPVFDGDMAFAIAGGRLHAYRITR